MPGTFRADSPAVTVVTGSQEPTTGCIYIGEDDDRFRLGGKTSLEWAGELRQLGPTLLRFSQWMERTLTLTHRKNADDCPLVTSPG